MTEIRTCNTILDTITNISDGSSSKFTFDSISKSKDTDKQLYFKVKGLPYDLNVSQIYIITSWNSNHYIRALTGDCFKVIEHYGADLDCIKEYILTQPKF